MADTTNASEPSEAQENTAELTSPAAGAYSAGDWQAIWSQPHNAYYFYNSKTQETTWTNPLQEKKEQEQETGASWDIYQMQAAAAVQGIDPSLAYLDPSLAAGPSHIPSGAFTAKFNARTGAFAKADAREPAHLSEYDRAKRMSEFYFDVGAWEKDVEYRSTAEYQEEEEKKRKKKPSKKDLDRFKEQKRLKKIAKTAWLRT